MQRGFFLKFVIYFLGLPFKLILTMPFYIQITVKIAYLKTKTCDCPGNWMVVGDLCLEIIVRAHPIASWLLQAAAGKGLVSSTGQKMSFRETHNPYPISSCQLVLVRMNLQTKEQLGGFHCEESTDLLSLSQLPILLGTHNQCSLIHQSTIGPSFVVLLNCVSNIFFTPFISMRVH